MTVITYKSTDASAPVLSGQAGALVALLDACLVDGYGAKSNAGWTKPFTATNKRAYRNSTTTGTGFYLDVDDSGPGAGTYKEARLRGYEVMTAVATGTGPFPTVAQATNGLFVRKSITLDSVARPWVLIADATVFYLFIESGDYTLPTRATGFSFGDFFSYKTSDAFRCQITGRDVENSGDGQYERFPQTFDIATGTGLNMIAPGHYIARGSNGLGGSIPFGLHGNLALFPSPISYPGVMANMMYAYVQNALQYPNSVDNGLYMSPAFIQHNSSLRGYLKGLWMPCHILPLGHGDVFSGTGALAAKAFLSQQFSAYSQGMIGAGCFMETSNTWS